MSFFSRRIESLILFLVVPLSFAAGLFIISCQIPTDCALSKRLYLSQQVTGSMITCWQSLISSKIVGRAMRESRINGANFDVRNKGAQKWLHSRFSMFHCLSPHARLLLSPVVKFQPRPFKTRLQVSTSGCVSICFLRRS